MNSYPVQTPEKSEMEIKLHNKSFESELALEKMKSLELEWKTEAVSKELLASKKQYEDQEFRIEELELKIKSLNAEHQTTILKL